MEADAEAPAVLVTGAANGIGEACATRFRSEGWRVIGWDIEAGHLPSVEWCTVNVADWDSVASAAADLPPLRAVVHCAGTISRTLVLETEKADWDRVVAINLTGTFYVARHVFEPLRQGSGVLINIGSIGATNVLRGRACYNSTKASVIAFTKHLAVEWGQAGVRAFCVSPGVTRTAMVRDAIAQGSFIESDMTSRTPLGRLVEPEEVAGAVFRLVGDDFSALSGANILIDNGFDAWGARL